ncbi:MAG: ATP-binding cassette domain-containing protein [Planctomycetes bacterium]|nr:ATP-binding cassette domain-containing protein [Planctomycetota bacterium]
MRRGGRGKSHRPGAGRLHRRPACDDDAVVSPSQAQAFRVEDLHKSYGPLHVLKGISIDFTRGKTTVVLGPSGCGKSVLLRHLVGLEKPNRGKVWFGDVRIDLLTERELTLPRRQIGFLFQQGALFDSLTVEENIAFPLIEHGVATGPKAHAMVEHVLHMVGLGEKIAQMPASLSGGQRKRLALARAIVMEPAAVLYDEPTTGLDPITSDIINELIMKLARELKITSIVVTHDLASAFKVADRIVMLHEGEVVMEGTPDKVRQSKLPVVSRFLRGEASPEELAEIQS